MRCASPCGKTTASPATSRIGGCAVHLDVALALGDQVEDHDALGAGLEQRRGRVGARRLVAPRRGEARVDEDRADQAHDAQDLATSASISRRPPRCAPRPAPRSPPPCRPASRRGLVLDQCAQPLGRDASRRDAHLQLHVARAGVHRRAVGSRSCRAGRAYRSGCVARTSSVVELDARGGGVHRDACRRARRRAPARKSQPGVTWSPVPPSSPGMSVGIRVPFAWLATMRVPPLPARGGRGVVVQAHLGLAPQDRSARCIAIGDFLRVHGRLPLDGAHCGRGGARGQEDPRRGGRSGRRGSNRRTGGQSAPDAPRSDARATMRDARTGRGTARRSRVAPRCSTPSGDRPVNAQVQRAPPMNAPPRSLRPQGPPAGGLGERRLRRHRHHAADRRRIARRGVRPALRRARARRRGRQRQRHARRRAPRLRGHLDRLRGRRCSSAAPQRAQAEGLDVDVPRSPTPKRCRSRTRASTPCCRRSA